MNNHIKYLNYAKHVSEFSDYRQHHIGAVLVCRRQIVSVGFNTNKTHPLQAEYNRFRDLNGKSVEHKAHAELICLNKVRNLDINFRDCTLYIFRQWKNGTWALARPCNACIKMIEDFDIGNVVYTTYENGYAVEYLKSRGE